MNGLEDPDYSLDPCRRLLLSLAVRERRRTRWAESWRSRRGQRAEGAEGGRKMLDQLVVEQEGGRHPQDLYLQAN